MSRAAACARSRGCGNVIAVSGIRGGSGLSSSSGPIPFAWRSLTFSARRFVGCAPAALAVAHRPLFTIRRPSHHRRPLSCYALTRTMLQFFKKIGNYIIRRDINRDRIAYPSSIYNLVSETDLLTFATRNTFSFSFHFPFVSCLHRDFRKLRFPIRIGTLLI